MRLERVLCGRGEARPALPASSPGKHCSKAVSIACDVDPVRLHVSGRRTAKVTLQRNDDFDSRCAGTLTLKGIGAKARKRARFNFRWEPPSAGGPAKRVVEIDLSRKLARSIRREGQVRAAAHPFGAFVNREVLDPT
jgi:hypothetical protein